MSKADEMFEKLKYNKSYDDEFKVTHYINNYNNDDVAFYENRRVAIISNGITMQELQAINEKCRELEWLE